MDLQHLNENIIVKPNTEKGGNSVEANVTEADVTELQIVSEQLVLKESKNTTKFCIDNFVDNNGTVETKVLVEMEPFVYPELTEEACSRRILGVYTALAAISILALLLTILIYSLLPNLRNLHGNIVICCAVSTLLATICLVAAYNYSKQNTGCQVLGFFGLFSNLSMFCWMTVMCWDLARTLASMRPPTGAANLHKLLTYSAAGWGGPFFLTAIALVCQQALPEDSSLNPRIGYNGRCFVDPDRQLIFFHLPVLLLLLANLGGFAYCTHHIVRTKAGASASVTKK
jgi:hypothetical protein